MTAQTALFIVIAIIVAIGSALGIPADNSVPAPAPDTPMMVLGYYMQDSRNASWPALETNKDVLTAVSPWGWGLTQDGGLRPVYFDERHLGDVLQFAGENDVHTHVLIHNFNPDAGSFDAAIADRVLTDATVRARAIANIVHTARRWGVTGVHIDFEGVAAARRDDLTAFMAKLRHELAPHRIQLSIAVPAITFATVNTPWTRAYDYAALANHVDFIMLMTYDQHWPGGSPGPVAALPWVRTVVDMRSLPMAATCPHAKWSSASRPTATTGPPTGPPRLTRSLLPTSATASTRPTVAIPPSPCNGIRNIWRRTCITKDARRGSKTPTASTTNCNWPNNTVWAASRCGGWARKTRPCGICCGRLYDVKAEAPPVATLVR